MSFNSVITILIEYYGDLSLLETAKSSPQISRQEFILTIESLIFIMPRRPLGRSDVH